LNEVNLGFDNINNIISTIIFEHHWHPSQVDALFLDRNDYYGALWHYEKIKQENDRIKNGSTS